MFEVNMLKIGTLVKVDSEFMAGCGKIGVIKSLNDFGRYRIDFLNEKCYCAWYYEDELLVLSRDPVNNYFRNSCHWCKTLCKEIKIKGVVNKYCPKCLR